MCTPPKIWFRQRARGSTCTGTGSSTKARARMRTASWSTPSWTTAAAPAATRRRGRRRAARRPGVVTAETREPRLNDDPDPVDTLAVRGALLDLAPRQRAVLVLRYFQDLDVATCARILDCTEGTVKSQTAKALKRLKELITEETGSS